MTWLSVPLANSLPDECKAGRTELCRALRSLGINLHNEHALTEQALKVTLAASQLLVDESLADQLKKDKEELERILKDRKKQEIEEAKWNKKIQIRSDEFEVNKGFVRYNSINIPVDEITGIKFGILTRVSYGVSNSSCRIDIRGRKGNIQTECSRLSHTEAQVKANFVTIIEAIHQQIIPNFIIRLAELVTSGNETVQIGPMLLTQNGIECETGWLWSRKKHVIPFSEWKFVDHQGCVYASAKKPEAISFSLDRREVWNAVILERLVEIIKLIQSQSKK